MHKYFNYLQEWRSKEVFGPRESKEEGECLYNCVKNDATFCKVQFELHDKTGYIGGNQEGLCFENGVCFGTPDPCVDCKERCEGFSGGSNADSPTCTTKDGKKCQFPFIYKGEKYEACPPDPEDPNENWCSTRTNEDGEHVGGGGHYGLCWNNCPLTE